MMKCLVFGNKAVSPVIGTILMVAVTVIMAAIVGGFVYQTGKPKIAPTLAATLEDDVRVVLTNGTENGRVATLAIDSGKNIARSELKLILIYTSSDSAEHTLSADGSDWDELGTPVYQGAEVWTNQGVYFKLVDSDGSTDLTPGDRLDFYEDGLAVPYAEVSPATDFTVKIIHKSTQATLVSQTVRVY